MAFELRRQEMVDLLPLILIGEVKDAEAIARKR